MLIGYLSTAISSDARVVMRQNLAQIGCDWVIEERQADLEDHQAPELQWLLHRMRFGDLLIVENLASLSSNSVEVEEIVRSLTARGIGIRSLDGAEDRQPSLSTSEKTSGWQSGSGILTGDW